MNRKTVLIIGILATIMVLGAVVAIAQNSSEKKKVVEKHECTPEMMEDMVKNCPEQMIKSAECENMKEGEKGHSGMMDNEKPTGEATDTDGENHCGDMDSDMDSMMSSSDSDMKGMM